MSRKETRKEQQVNDAISAKDFYIQLSVLLAKGSFPGDLARAVWESQHLLGEMVNQIDKEVNDVR